MDLECLHRQIETMRDTAFDQFEFWRRQVVCMRGKFQAARHATAENAQNHAMAIAEMERILDDFHRDFVSMAETTTASLQAASSAREPIPSTSGALQSSV